MSARMRPFIWGAEILPIIKSERKRISKPSHMTEYERLTAILGKR
jgi:hypothetical protein